jgi:tRNA A-37 threonylcarbamoyl transferase component Bud32
MIDINPRYRDLLVQNGWADLHYLQNLPATIISGHPDRHVLRGTLGSMSVYIKRQHRVRWRERLASAWAGFGWVSASRREAAVLEQLRGAGVPAPEWIAAGETDQGQAFLILQAIPDTRELPAFLRGPLGQSPLLRRRLARLLGQTLAHMHDVGFAHADLYAKHVLVHTAGTAVHFIDWQRVRRRREVAWHQRWRDLSALEATLADELASPRDRLACLHAYCRATLTIRTPRDFRRRAIGMIREHSLRLQRYRRIREQRQNALPVGSQAVIWLDGERLCVTPEFRRVFADRVPDWLTAPVEEDRPITVPGSARATLVRRRRDEMARWLWARLWRRHLTSPEFQQAAMLFRLQRYGVETPRLLAFGQRHSAPWRTESFLLTDVPPSASLTEWLRRPACWTAERKRRWQVIRDAGDLLRRTHEAGCHGIDSVAQVGLREGCGVRPRVVLQDVSRLTAERDLPPRAKLRDLRRLRRSLPTGMCSRTDQLRFLMAYASTRQSMRELLRQIVASRPFVLNGRLAA